MCENWRSCEACMCEHSNYYFQERTDFFFFISPLRLAGDFAYDTFLFLNFHKREC